jgi:ABC-type multidrug transport system fused ATPase/permease subunit
VLAFVALCSVAVGTKPISLGTVLQSFTHYDPTSSDHLIIRSLRVPRTEIGLLVGSALGAAGAVMQGVARNPLGAVLASITTAVLLLDVATLDQFRFWNVGSLAARLTLVPAALTGALLVLAADLVGRRAFAPHELGRRRDRRDRRRVPAVAAGPGQPGGDGGLMDQPPAPATLAAEHLHLAYDRVEVAADLTVAIPPEQITVIVGANACGKSTLLRALARLLKTKAGVVLLDGRSIHGLPTKAVASRLGILPQTPIAPEGISVADLVARGRYPHQSWFRQWTGADERIVATAM